MENSLLIIKPGFMEFEEKILSRLAQIQVSVVRRKVERLQSEVLKEHYAHLIEKPFYPEIEEYMTSSDVIIFEVTGEIGTVEKIRELLGSTRNAPQGTLRGDFTDGNGMKNLMHASDSVENAQIEIARFF